jgi:hypothetical protein
MTGADTESVDKPTNCPQEEYLWVTSFKIWDEAHLLGLMVPKGKTDQVNKIVTIATGVWERNSSVRQDSVLPERRTEKETT